MPPDGEVASPITHYIRTRHGLSMRAASAKGAELSSHCARARNQIANPVLPSRSVRPRPGSVDITFAPS
jgi:hypothetical protein